MSPRSLRKPEGSIKVCLPYDGDMDEDMVRRAAINRLRTHSDPEKPVFSGGQISTVHVDPAYPPAVLIGVMDADGLCMLLVMELHSMEEVELLEEHLDLAKESIREEKQDEAEADD